MTLPVSRRIQAAKPLAIAIAVSTLFSASALAQQKSLEPVVVTATRTPQIAKEVLADNVVITADDIARSGYTSLADVLQRQRGMEIVRNGGPGTTTSVFLRGTSNSQNVVLVDGVRVGSSTSGGANWNAIPLSQIERVEIVYGPLSTMYGADAVGGVIQIFTKQGEGAPAATVSAGAGSFGTRSLEAGVSGSSGGLRYAIQAGHERSDGFSARPGAAGFNPEDDGHESNSVSGQLGLELAEGHEIGATFLHNRLNSQYDQSATFNDRNRQKLATFGVYLKNRITSNWNSNLQVAQSRDEGTNIAAPSWFSPTGISFFDTTQKTVSWQNSISLGKDLLQLIAEQRKEEVDSSNTALNRTRTTDSLAAAYQLRRDAHLAAVSIRQDDNSVFGDHVTGNASYGYMISKTLRVNAAVGTSFRAPTFNELYFPGYGDPSVKPEKGKNAELGLYYKDGGTQYSAVYFHNRLTDLIASAPCSTNPTDYCATNVDKALLRGLSFGASTMLGNFTLRGSLDLQNPENETTGKQLARRAKKHGTVGVDYNRGPLSTGGEIVFSGKRFENTTNTQRLGGYGVVNLYANYEVAPSWTVFGRWNNVLDKEYELAKDYNTAESNVFVGVRYAMK